ncbi:uncharacterized protein LOC132734719 isoform X5 [Ruditapes philippinarum]|uniref:uncharacterized protein LOC132734719 isoform X5 n=1 Tax=Ruditapes philippinarum TaxID=129788 RepID=UPI00295B9F1D|nr:uncharacterized protein LOC132734719 isoform X5 [Ruditapes philippinarum]
MSWCIITLLVTTAVSAVTSQGTGIDGNSGDVINNMLAGGHVSSDNLLSAIGIGDRTNAQSGSSSQAGPMKKFTLKDVQTMLDGAKNGFRYKYDGTVSNDMNDVTITESQLIAMRDQLIQMGRESTTKQFSTNELRTMIDGMNNGLFYNRQGQVTTQESGDVLYTLKELQDLQTQYQAEEQALQQFKIDDIRRIAKGMESGLKYNYQGQIASEGQRTLSQPVLRRYLQQIETTAGPSGLPTDVQTMPDINKGGIDSGITTTKQFTLADLERMKQGIKNGLQYNYQGQMATQGQATLTAGQIDELIAKLKAKGPMIGTGQSTSFTLNDINRMLSGMDGGMSYNYIGQEAQAGEQTLTRDYLTRLLNQLNPQGGITTTKQFTLADLERMKQGITTGLKYNYQGQLATQGQATLTAGQIDELIAKLKAKGPMIGTGQSTSFTLNDINRMLSGMDGGMSYNYLGQEAQAGEQTLTRDYLTRLLNQLNSQGGMGTMHQTARFTLQDIDNMLQGMDQGRSYNYQGTEAKPGELTLTRKQLEKFRAELQAKSMGGLVTTPKFTLRDLERMFRGMDQGIKYNYNGQEAKRGDKILSRLQLNEFLADLNRKGMGVMLETGQFTLQDIDRMLTGMDNGFIYNYNGQQAQPGEKTLSRNELNQFKKELAEKVTGREFGTKYFTMDDIFKMLEGMDRGLKYNYQGTIAKEGEQALTRNQLEQLMSRINKQGSGNPTEAVPFTREEINKMLTGMKSGYTYNTKGLEAKPGEEVLTTNILNKYLSSLRLPGYLQNMTGQFSVADLENMINGMQTGQKFNYQGLPAATGEPYLSTTDLNHLLEKLHSTSGINRTGTIDTTEYSSSSNKSSGGQISGTGPMGGTFESTFSKESSQSNTSSETVFTFGTGGSNVVDLNPVVKDSGHFRRETSPIGSGENIRTDSGKVSGFTDSLREKSVGASNKKLKNATIVIAENGSTTIQADEGRLLSNIKASQRKNDSTANTKKDRTKSNITKGLTQIGQLADEIGTVNIIIHTGSDSLSTDSSEKGVSGRHETIVEKDIRETTNITETSRTHFIHSNTLIPRFTVEEIRRLMEGIRQGLRYNQQGEPAKSGENPLTMDQLSQYLSNAKTKDESRPDIPASRFTRDEIIRLRDGISNGQAYNYMGYPAKPGEKTLTVEILNRLLNDISATGTRYTREQINKMIEDTKRGRYYNRDGSLAVGNEPRMTLDDLYRYLQDIDTTGNIPKSRFTREQINRMIEDTKRGRFYNRDGNLAVANEPRMTLDDLNRLLQNLDYTGPQRSRLTRQQILNMIEGMKRGLYYNQEGKEVLGNEPRLTLDDLNRYLRDFDNTATVQRPKFTREQINRMIEDTNRGRYYNQDGKLVVGNEPRMTLDDLNRYLQEIDRITGIQRPKFTREQINRMIEDTNRGRYYNKEGKLVVGNEPRMTLDDLNRYLQTIDRTSDIPRSKFTREQINRMIDDTRRGRFYNKEGNLAVGNEPRMTLNDLNRYLQTLEYTTGIQRPKFTREHINRMIEDMNRGRYYNQDGKLVVGNEPRMTLDDLNRYLQTIDKTTGIQRPKFTREQINRMIEDTNRGRYYNQEGKLVVGNEPRMTLDDLNRYLQTIDRTSDIPRSKFTREQINRMIDDTRRGRFYNKEGNLAVGNEPRMTLDDLNRYLQTLEYTTGVQRPKFTREQINRMIEDTNRGRYYNQEGKLVVGNEPRMTLDDLNRYLQTIDRTTGIQRPKFTREQINRMIEDTNRGRYYNLDGKLVVGNEPRMTLDDLNRYLQTIDRTSGIPRSKFTREQINRMIDDTRRGRFYNKEGNLAVGNEPRMTLDDLNRYLQTLEYTTGIQRPKFTREQINRMIEDTNRGRYYNQDGKLVVGNEPRMTLDDLNRYLQTIDRTTGIQRPKFTREQINKMIEDTNRGRYYNQEGKLVVGNEPRMTLDDLNRYLQTIDRTTGVQKPKFTREQINRMIEDTNRGRYYNKEGKLVVGNEPRMTLDDLNRYLQTIDRTSGIPRSKFTREQINRMIDDTRRGRFYNKEGNLAVSNEPRMTLDDLNRYLQTLEYTTGIQRPKFTREQINRMIEDTNRGRYYNQDGKLVVGNEPRMTLDDLNRYLQTIDRTTGIQRPKFTREQINKMIEDTNRGRYYNQEGKLVVGNEPRMTLDDLNRYLQTIDRTSDIPRSKFTREQINRMIDDTRRGRFYNKEGNLAVGNEPRMTLDDLNRYLQTLEYTTGIQRPKFTREQINRMIEDMNRGRYYNQEGKLVVGNEPRMTLDDLNRYLQTIDRTTGIQKPKFTREQINRMIDDTNRGRYYNQDGKLAVGNEPRMTLDDLNRYLQTIDRTSVQRPKFTREQINRMIEDTNRGRYYNQDGKLVVGNEPRMTLDDLNRYLQTIDRTTGIQRPKFTREQINRMIEDTNRGRYYNQDGKLAVGNEPRMTLDDLNRYLQTIDRTTGIQRPKFTREQINRMIEDTNRGRYYNQEGKLVVGNEPRMTLDDLNRYLQTIDRTTGIQRPKFTREQINRMIEDTNRGRYYNQEGKLVVGNEPRMTLDDLNRYLQTIDRTSIQRPKFTREQINRMIEDTNRGRYYNQEGKLVVGNEPRMTLDDLNRYFQEIADIQRPKFTREQINRMIEDTNRGRYYNQDGKLAVGSEPRMTLDDLNRYLQTIDRTTGIQRPKFTREQINRMIQDTNRGRYYNLDGKLAVGNEPRMTLDDLNRYLQDIGRTTGIQRPKFTREQINRMIDDTNRGRYYNQDGKLVVGNEPRMTLDDLNRYLQTIDRTTGIQRPKFTREQINRMIE